NTRWRVKPSQKVATPRGKDGAEEQRASHRPPARQGDCKRWAGKIQGKVRGKAITTHPPGGVTRVERPAQETGTVCVERGQGNWEIVFMRSWPADELTRAGRRSWQGRRQAGRAAPLAGRQEK